MRRTWLLCASAALAGAAALHANVLPNGLELTTFEVETQGAPAQGTVVTVTMVLTNIGGEAIRFDRNTPLFVAARVNSTSDANNRDFGRGRRGLVLAQGKSVKLVARRTLDTAGEWRFWPGFRLENGAGAPFRWMEKTLVVASPGQAGKSLGAAGGTKGDGGPGPGGRAAGDGPSGSGPGDGGKGLFARMLDRILGLFSRPSGTTGPSHLQVSALLQDPGRYDGRIVELEGNALVVRQKSGGILMSLSDTEQPEKVLTAFGPGPTEASNGDKVRVRGTFRRKSPRGRYTYDNEIEMGQGGLAVISKGFFLRRETRNPLREYRTVARAPFDPAARGVRFFGAGQAVPIRFHVRLYTNTPRFHTLVREANGAATWQVVSWEQGHGILGHPTLPKAGRTFVAVHLKVKGDAGNQGDPGKWYQFPAGEDPSPCFFLTGRDGSVTWPAMETLVLVNRERTYVNLDHIPLADNGWQATALLFDPPEGIADPVLVAITWPGGSGFELTGVRLK
ncbi:MAG: hypothetical protein WBS54_14255 [Acidobacteriota bacterium]